MTLCTRERVYKFYRPCGSSPRMVILQNAVSFKIILDKGPGENFVLFALNVVKILLWHIQNGISVMHVCVPGGAFVKKNTA